MKKVLVMLAVMAIAMGSVFSADPAPMGTGSQTATNLSSLDPATLQVTLDLGSESGLGKHYQVGFSSVEVKDIDDVADAKTLPLETPTATGDLSGTTNVYWAIKDSASLSYKIALNIAANLKSDSDNTGIAWKVAVGEGGEAEEVTVSDASTYTAIKTISTTGGFDVDSLPLTISTVGLRSTATTKNESYSGTLFVKIITG